MSESTPNDAVISDDTKRGNRIPPGQAQTRKWPILHAGTTPDYSDLSMWDFYVFGEVEPKRRFNWTEFSALQRVKVYADMHCVTRWTKLDNTWEGVPTRELLKFVTPKPTAKFVMVHCEQGFTTNLSVDDFFGDDCLFGLAHDGMPLEPDHGYPVRLVIPKLYAWKSAKWVRGIEFMTHDQPGFWESWENGGYHMRGDPRFEDRFRE
jgi:DMSO/TMAO reductase YedYZ molybdopterin-dependent catalytic subunit